MSKRKTRLTPARSVATLVVLLAVAAWQMFTDGGGLGAFAPNGAATHTERRNPASALIRGDENRPSARREQLPVDSTIENAYRARMSDQIVQEVGNVKVVLRDDNEGSRHQRLIVELDNGRTVLIAHNIDLAPRIPVERGDRIEFRGEYEWNEKGGVVHWTHRDPQGRHDHGWIEHAGRRYE